ncbi:MAG: hypothetical protein LH479_09465 [Polaromonas sp.]|nr:hypothetical protein [Polaromonas sp.]
MTPIHFSPFTRLARLALFGSAVGATALLSGCVVAPLGPPVAVYRSAPVYVEQGPVVVVPGAPGGYYGPGYRAHPYGGYRGYRRDGGNYYSR